MDPLSLPFICRRFHILRQPIRSQQSQRHRLSTPLRPCRRLQPHKGRGMLSRQPDRPLNHTCFYSPYIFIQANLLTRLMIVINLNVRILSIPIGYRPAS
jgi:hypothetical protein